MPYSARDLAREAADELSRSSDSRLSAGAGKVEEALTRSNEPPTHFDIATAIAIAGLIIKIAELGYKVWSDLKNTPDGQAAIKPGLESAVSALKIQADPKLIAETVSAVAGILQRS